MLQLALSALVLLTATISLAAEEIQIVGSVQFWQRTCSETYRCELPAAVGERLPIAALISEPAPGATLSTQTIDFTQAAFSARLSVFWIKNTDSSYLAGQSFLQKDGVRIAECSQYASSKTETFIPVGFCAGYTTTNGTITQYGMTFYK